MKDQLVRCGLRHSDVLRAIERYSVYCALVFQLQLFSLRTSNADIIRSRQLLAWYGTCQLIVGYGAYVLPLSVYFCIDLAFGTHYIPIRFLRALDRWQVVNVLNDAHVMPHAGKHVFDLLTPLGSYDFTYIYRFCSVLHDNTSAEKWTNSAQLVRQNCESFCVLVLNIDTPNLNGGSTESVSDSVSEVLSLAVVLYN